MMEIEWLSTLARVMLHPSSGLFADAHSLKDKTL
jgi:hypothetical protein